MTKKDRNNKDTGKKQSLKDSEESEQLSESSKTNGNKHRSEDSLSESNKKDENPADSESTKIFKSFGEIESWLKEEGAFSKMKEAKTEWSQKCPKVLDDLIETLKNSPKRKFIAFKILVKFLGKGRVMVALNGKKSQIEQIFYGEEKRPPDCQDDLSQFEQYLSEKFNRKKTKDEISVFLENGHHLPAILEIEKYHQKITYSGKTQMDKTESFLQVLNLFAKSFLSLNNQGSPKSTGDNSIIMDLFRGEFYSILKPKNSSKQLAEMIRWTVAFKDCIAPENERLREKLVALEEKTNEFSNDLVETQRENENSLKSLVIAQSERDSLAEKLRLKEADYDELMENLKREKNLLKSVNSDSMNAKLEEIHKVIGEKAESLRAFLEREKPNVDFALAQLDDMDEKLKDVTNR